MIRIRQVRLIDDAGNMAGIVDTDVARQMAYEKGLDLVEVSPDARPPVCKVMDYGKFKYALKKKEHESKRKQHQVQTKEIRLRPKIAEHDVSYKVTQARHFLLDGDKVQVTMLFRGREMSHMDVARVVMDQFIQKLADISKVERHAKMEGRRLSLLLLSTAPPKPDKVNEKKAEPEKAEKPGKAGKPDLADQPDEAGKESEGEKSEGEKIDTTVKSDGVPPSSASEADASH